MRWSRGFTLLELLVVLVILGLAAAVTTPAFVKLVNSLQEQDKQDKAVLYLQQLPVDVMREGSPRTLPETQGYTPAPEALGDDAEDLEELRVWIPEPIEYRTNGACTGGVTHWELPGEQRFTLDLAAPLCKPQPRT